MIGGLLIGLAGAAALLTLGVFCFTGVPALPSSPRVVAVVRAMAGELLAGETRPAVVDLGAGYGDLLLATVAALPGARGIGFELSPVPWLIARARAAARRLPVTVRLTDFRRADFGKADLVLLYLTRRPLAEVAELLPCRLHPGTPVISTTFAIEAWRAERVVRAEDLYRTPVYLYRSPQPSPRLVAGRSAALQRRIASRPPSSPPPASGGRQGGGGLDGLFGVVVVGKEVARWAG